MRSIFKTLFLSLLTVGSVGIHTAVAQKQTIICNTSTGAACSISSNPGNGTQGDPAWLLSGKSNFNFDQIFNMLGPTGTLPVPLYGLQFNNNGTLGSLIPGSTGTWCFSWPSLTAAPTLVSCGSGSGTVTSVGLTVPSWLSVSPSSITTSGTFAISGTIEPNNLVLASASSGSQTALAPRGLVAADIPTISASTGLSGTLQAAQEPAHTGDVTNTAGSLATTVGKVNGLPIPPSASLVGTNSSSQFVSVTTPLSLALGGTGTASPGLVSGSNISVTGTWPNQTVNANIGSSSFTALTSGTNAQAAMLVGTGASLAASGSGTIAATNTTGVNGAAVPASALVLGSNSLGQLLFETTTGTGFPVLSNSPTLVTPVLGVATATSINGTTIPASSTLLVNGGALGTPSSVVLTNATGLPNSSVIGLGTFATANAATPPAIGGTTPAAGTFSSLKNSGITGLTQCLHADSTGLVSGTGADCGSGGGGTGFPALTGGTNTTAAMLVGTGASLGVSGSGTIAATSMPAAGLSGTLQAAQEPAHTGDVTNTAGSLAMTVKGINGVLTSGLATGILKNTTTTGVPSIAVAADFPALNQSTTGNAATASALAAIGTQCTGGQFATGVTVAGNANCATPAGGGNVSNVATPLNGQIAQWTSATTIQGLAVTGTGNAVLATSPTLVTPALGTPSALVLTNATGLPNASVIGLGTFATANAATPPAIGGTTPAAGVFSSLKDTGVTGSTQCLHVDTTGAVTGTGSDCGAGGSTAFSAITAGTNAAALVVGTGGSLTTSGTGSITATAAPVAGISGLGTGVATFLATPSSANLASAVTGETGTGALVLGTSPTLATPALAGSSTGTTTFASANAGASNFTLTFPAATDTVVTLAATQTLTNKSIAASEVNSGTLAAAQMPALTGDVTSTSGTVATTVGKINGTTLAGLATGLLKNTTATGVPSIATSADVIADWSGTCSATTFLRGDGSCQTPAGSGTVTTTGTPASGNLSKFSGAASVTNGDLSGDVTTAGTLATTVVKVNGAVVPTSAALLASNSSNQLTALTLAPNLTITSGVLGTTQALNAQTGTTYTMLSTDAGKLATFSNAATVAVTLPVATSAGFTAGYSFDTQDVGATLVTITPTTSTINGAASLPIEGGLGCTVTSDGTNYQTSACTALIPYTPLTWNAVQTFTNSDIKLLGSSTGATTFTSANAGASNFTMTFPAITDTLVALTATQTLTNKSIAGSEINSGTVGTGFGGTGAASLAGANIPVQSGAITSGHCVQWATSTSITDSGATCGAGGSTAFSALTSSTNVTAAMLVGTGASLGVTGTGTISANQVNGATVPASAGMVTTNASNQIVAEAVVVDAAPGAGPTNDYSPTGFGPTTGVLYITPTAGGTTFNGMAAQNALQHVYIVNAEAAGGADLIKLVNQSASDTTAANRFLTSATVSLAIPPGGRVLCVYLPSAVSRWSCQ